MKLLEKGPWVPLKKGRGRSIRYRARFWEGPIEAGRSGRYVEQDCDDTLFDVLKSNPDGSERQFRGFANTSPSVSYHSELLRQALK